MKFFLPPPLNSRRSPSLARFAIAAIILIICVKNNAIAGQKTKNWGENFNDNVIKSMIDITKNAVSSKNINNISNSINKNIFKQEGTATIETKNGNLKIDTQNAESMRLAAEFRKNYKKSKECLEPANEKISIKCANEYIRARKAAMK